LKCRYLHASRGGDTLKFRYFNLSPDASGAPARQLPPTGRRRAGLQGCPDVEQEP